MMRILMILAVCTLPTAPRAQTELTPWLFDLQSQFNDGLNAASDDHSHSCHAVLEAGFTPAPRDWLGAGRLPDHQR